MDEANDAVVTPLIVPKEAKDGTHGSVEHVMPVAEFVTGGVNVGGGGGGVDGRGAGGGGGGRVDGKRDVGEH